MARVTAALKDNLHVSCRMIAESTGIPKTVVHRILTDDENTKTVCTICAACVDSGTTGTAHCSHKRLNHRPYSPDLSPPDYFAFPKLKMELKGHQYATISGIQPSVTAKLKTIPITDFSRAMHRLEDHTNQYIAINSDYFK